MIHPAIQQEHLLKALAQIDKVKYPSRRESDNYDLWFNNIRYPPKVVISYAENIATRITNKRIQFSGGDETNNFLIDNRFPIVEKDSLNPYQFFSPLEVKFFASLAGKRYDETSAIDRNAGFFVKTHLWSKTRRWADLAAGRRFDVTGKAQWNDRTQEGQRFKSYTWYKLHLKELPHEKVFYTVGVHHNGDLVIKIDCQRQGTNKLPDYQVRQINQIIESKRAGRRIITPPEFGKYDWNKLRQFSEKFINETLPVYREIIALLAISIDEKCGRICWNSEQWAKPSGRTGKSTTSPSRQAFIHERENGFAPEEWLFDLAKQIDGYCYGRIEPVHTDRDKHVGKTINLTLFTYDGSARQWYWVGRIENAYILDQEESERITWIFKQNGWFEERLAQLEVLEDVNAESFRNWDPGDLFNIRFLPWQVSLFGNRPFGTTEKPPTPYYNLADRNFLPTFETAPPAGTLIFNDHLPAAKKGKNKITRHFKEHYSEIENLHSQIQDNLFDDLNKRYPRQVFKECRKSDFDTRVDLVLKHKSKTVFYEIKTYPNVLFSIRVAIGQLLEYAYYPEVQLADELIIVSHLEAKTEHLRYLAYLSDRLGLKISYLNYHCNPTFI